MRIHFDTVEVGGVWIDVTAKTILIRFELILPAEHDYHREDVVTYRTLRFVKENEELELFRFDRLKTWDIINRLLISTGHCFTPRKRGRSI